MNLTILNRGFEHPSDGWYHIEPKGEHPNQAGKVIQVIDDPACESIVNRFNGEAAGGLLSHGREMLIDHEHFKHAADKETIAYGWLQELEQRPDGVYGRIRWSATGQKAVDGGDYRFFSTEYEPADLAVLNESSTEPLPARAETSRVRPLRLAGLTLTNDPNNQGARPITNRQHDAGPNRHGHNEAEKCFDGHPDSTCGRDAVTEKNNQTKNRMKNIATKLNLAAEASEDAIIAEVTRLQNRMAALEPLPAENLTLKNRLTELDAEQVETLMDAHGILAEETGKREKLKPVLLGLKNRAERKAFLIDCVPTGTGHANALDEPRAGAHQNKLHNRDTRPPGESPQTPGETPAAAAGKAAKIMNRARELKKASPNLSHATTVIMAQRELEAGN